MDRRFGYRIPLSKQRRLELAVDVYPGGNQNAPPTFLVLNAYRTCCAPRKAQIGARIQF
jgi:hypothetical protein